MAYKWNSCFGDIVFCFKMMMVMVYVALPASAIFIGGEQDVGSPLRVAQCRATCLERFSNDGPNGESMCLQGPDCFMCWENCELLQSNFQVWGQMCDEKEICFPGCQEACRFHAEASTRAQQSQPVIHTKGEGVIRVSGALARWPRPTSTDPNTPLIYVVMKRSQAGPWRQIIQTIDLTTRVPVDSDQAGSTLRVLVVDPQGLVTIYSPDEKSVRDNGKKRKKTINTEIKATTSKSTSADNGVWELKEVSLIHQKVLVIGEIAWEPKTKRGVYLVTWEVDGGGLKGNLFTDSTCVTLSLWPDTVYHIQVELVSHTPGLENLKSQMLDLDTGRAQRVSTESQEDLKLIASDEAFDKVESREGDRKTPLMSVLVSAVRGESLRRERMEHLELMGGTVAAILVFIVILAALVWKCRIFHGTGDFFMSGDSSIPSHKLVEDFTCNKGFQPIVTVVTGDDRSRSTNSNGGPTTTSLTPDVAFLCSSSTSTRGSAAGVAAAGGGAEPASTFVGRNDVQV